jgi:hypothetical protein
MSSRKKRTSIPSWAKWFIFWVVALIIFLSIPFFLFFSSAVVEFAAKNLPNELSGFLFFCLFCICLIVGILIYFVPYFVGCSGKHPQAIYYANLLLGWTGIGWIGVLIWAIAERETKNRLASKGTCVRISKDLQDSEAGTLNRHHE